MPQTFEESAKELVRQNPDSVKRLAQYHPDAFTRAMAQVFLAAAGEQ
jgi:hypothetical protein